MGRIDKRVLFPFLLLAVLTTFAGPARAVADWPPVSPQDLALKDNPASPGSPAMILNREQSVNNTKLYEQFYYRIKIFSDAGKGYADIQIPFSKGFIEVKDIAARTVHPDGSIVNFDGKVMDGLLLKAGEVKVQVRKFSLPEVTPGSIIEYRYTLQYRYLFLGAGWRIQDSLYTRKAHFSFEPYHGPAGQTLVAAPLLWRSFLVGDVKPERQKDGTWALDVNDIQGVPEEDFTLPIEELRGRVEFVYSAEKHTGNAKQYWDLVAKENAEREEKFIGKHGSIHDLAAHLFAPDDSPDAKLRKLYARAQEIHNLSDEEEKTAAEEKRDKTKANNNVEDVLKHGYAGKANINRFFVALAQAAGFDASLVWVTPRSKARFHMEFEDSSELTDTLVWVHAGDKDYFLNPSVSLCPFGLLPWYETEVTAFRPTSQGVVFMQTPPASNYYSAISRVAHLSLDTEGTLSGPLVVRFIGQRALTRRSDAREEDETGRKKMITDEIKSWFPSGSKFELTAITGWDKSDAPLEAQGTLTLTGLADSIGRRMLLPMGLYKASTRQLFDTDTRLQDIYFAYPYDDVDDITIQMPSGYRTATLPAPVNLDPGGQLRYLISAKLESDALHIQRRLSVGAILFPVDSYSSVRQFFSQAKVEDEQQLVLQSAAAADHN